MTEIRLLSEELVNQIAAGEVVERPASVVKELVENALDAGATRIDVSIADGGLRWICVEDDGSGMSRTDAPRAFERHATSKIACAADLVQVATLGFRGEALPSIASVARVRLRTRREQDAVGTELRFGDAAKPPIRDVACPAGTRIEVAELFERVPARRKFLKSATTEAGHVVRWIERMALVRPDVRFALERDGRSSLLLLPTRNTRERVIAILPPSVGERLREVNAETVGARLSGYTSPTDVQRGSTTEIHLYVNSRPVRDRFLMFAVRDVYRDALAPGRHPVAALFLDIDPEQVDVNVHPAKWEVRFHQPDAIRRLIRDGLQQAIGLGGRARPPESRPSFWGSTSHVADGEAPHDFALAGPEAPAAPAWRDPALDGGEAAPTASFPPPGLRYLGQALGVYLICEAEQGLVMIDQHAAHERVLFERMRQALHEGKLERQTLLLPIPLELPRSAADALRTAASDLERGGFELEVAEAGVRGGVRVTLRAVPAILADRRDVEWGELLEETAATLTAPEESESRGGLERALHGILATAACHAATRKGDRLEVREAEALLESLADTVWFPNCPHGRPILSALPEAELERRFQRR